ncbi:hypothetical protein WCE37_01145 [Luteimonas sp. MJ250]|uniref:hypothetical protein n=1 Tax=Luteimonas sp. MJ250 TaxID=3129236 RepID=UPI0031BA85B3
MTAARACTREEVEVLHLYRTADAKGKDRLVKTAILAIQGRLSSLEEVQAMGPHKLRALVDSMQVDQ